MQKRLVALFLIIMLVLSMYATTVADPKDLPIFRPRAIICDPVELYQCDEDQCDEA